MKHPLASLAGAPLLWLAHFVAVYAAASLVCAHPSALPLPATPLTAWAAGLLTAAALGIAAAALVRNARRLRGHGQPEVERFTAAANAWLYALAIVGMLWVGLPALMLPACA